MLFDCYQAFYFPQYHLKFRWQGCNNFDIHYVLMMRRGWQMRKMTGVIVPKDYGFIGALIMIGVRQFDRIGLSNKQFPKMQSGIVYEVNVAAKEPGFFAIFERNALVMHERG